MKITKIVAATDFSQPAEQAIAQAMRLARRTGAEVVLVHVGPVAERQEIEPRFGTYEREVRIWAESMFRQRRTELEALRERLVGQGVEVSQAIHEGSPPEALCDAAEQLHADLVVVGSHGHTGVRRFLLGSVAEKTLRMCRTNVFVARPPTRPGGFRRILVPIDFDQWSDAALEAALALAADDAEIELLHCWRLPTGLLESWGVGRASVVAEIRKTFTDHNDEKLNQLAKRHQTTRVRVSCLQAEASARHGILQHLDTGEYDLVVVGSHSGDRPRSGWLAGNVAEATARHAPCSVLVVRTHTPARRS